MDKKHRELTWPKAALWIGLTQLLSLAAGIALAAGRVHLAPPLMASTPALYIFVATAPATITLIACLFRRPRGRIAWGALTIVTGTVLVCVYLALIGPALGTVAVKCSAPEQDGIFVRQACVCQVQGDSGVHMSTCTLDGPAFLPFRRVTGPFGR